MMLRRIVFSLPEAGLSLMFAAINAWYLYFLVTVADMPPLAAGSAFFLGRFFDACIDPFVGAWADRRGRRRPRTRLVGLAIVPTALLFACLWWAPGMAQGQASQFLLVTVTFAAFGLGYTCVAIPRLAMLPSYAPERPARAAQVMTDMVLSLLAVAAGAALLPGLAEALAPGASGWRRAGAIAGLIAALLCLPFILAVRDESARTPAAAPPLRTGLRSMAAALRLPCVLPALLRFWVSILGLFMLQSLLPFFLERRIGVAAGDQMPAMASVFCGSLASLPAWAKLTGQRGQRSVTRLAATGLIAVLCLVPLLPAAGLSPAILGMGLAFGVLTAGLSLGAWMLVPETAGNSPAGEGLTSSLFTFANTTGAGTAMLVNALILRLAGEAGGAVIAWAMALIPGSLACCALALARRER